MSFKRILPARPMLESIREGLNHEQLMDKYGLSTTDLSMVLSRLKKDVSMALSRLQGERDRRATQIIQDLLSGLEVQEIATKNGFWDKRFVAILQVALSLKLGGSLSLTAETEPISFHSSYEERRRHPRISYPVLTPHVTDSSCPEKVGTIHDISEKGVAVKGVNASVGDEKILLISENTFDSPDPIVLTCSCRWTGKAEQPDLGQSAGFEIVGISESDDRYLKSLIEAEQHMTCSL